MATGSYANAVAGRIVPLRVKLSAKERTAYPVFFDQADLQKTGKVEGRTAVEFFRRSGLSVDVLKGIWTTSTPGGEGFLDRERFYVALRLIALAQQGRPPTAQSILAGIEVDLPQFGGTQVASESFDVTPEDKEKFEKIFANNFPGKTAVNGTEARQLFERTGVEHADLVKIWNLSDPHDTGVLTKTQFIVAMQLILKARQRVKIPDSLPAPLQALISAAASPQRTEPTRIGSAPASRPPADPSPRRSVRTEESDLEPVGRPAVDTAATDALLSISQDLMRTVRSLEAKLDQVTTEVRASRGVEGKLEEVSAELRATKAELKAVKDSQTQRHAEVLAQIDDLSKAHKRAANEDRDNREALIRAVREELAGLEGQMAPRGEAGPELAEIRDELNDLRRVKTDIGALRDDLKVLADVRSHFSEVQSGLQALQRNVGGIEDLRRQLQGVEARLEAIDSHSVGLKLQSESALEQLQQLGKEMEDLQGKVMDARAEPAQVTEKRESRQEERQEPVQIRHEEAKVEKVVRMNDPFAVSSPPSNLIKQSDPFDFDALSQPSLPLPPGKESPKALKSEDPFEDQSDPAAFDFSGGKSSPPRGFDYGGKSSPKAQPDFDFGGERHSPQDFDFDAGKASPPAQNDFDFIIGKESQERPKASQETDPFAFSPGQDDDHFDFPGQSGAQGLELEGKEGKDDFDFDADKKKIDFDF